MARYYPNGSGNNRKPRKDDPNPVLDPGIDGDVTLENNFVSHWLYEDNWSQQKLNEYRLWCLVPGVSEYFDYLLDIRADQEYLDRYNLDYSDIHDPRKLKSTSSGTAALRSGLNFVSDMAKYLYKKF